MIPSNRPIFLEQQRVSPAPIVVGSTSSWASTSISATGATQTGDLIILQGYVRGTGGPPPINPSPPAGFTIVPGWPIVANGADDNSTIHHYCWYNYAAANGAADCSWSGGNFPFFSGACLVVRGGPTSGAPFSEQDLEQGAPDNTLNLPACQINLAGPNSLMLYLATDRNDADIMSLSMAPDPNHTWNMDSWNGIGSFDTTQVSSGLTGLVNAVGAATGTFAKTAALVSLRAPG